VYTSLVPTLRARRRIPAALQLFSVRDQCERNLPQTLATVRRFGYEGVEFAGFYGWRSREIRKLLYENSLTPCGSHTPLDQLTGDKFAETVAFNAKSEKVRRDVKPGACIKQGWWSNPEAIRGTSALKPDSGIRYDEKRLFPWASSPSTSGNPV
jgi:hypothetical protein